MIADLANIPTDALFVLLGIAVAWGGVTISVITDIWCDVNFHAEQRCMKKLGEIEAKLDDILKG